MEFQLINAVRSGDVEAVKVVLDEANAMLNPSLADPAGSSGVGDSENSASSGNPYVFMGGSTPLHWYFHHDIQGTL